jgi:hypothetical protein
MTVFYSISTYDVHQYEKRNNVVHNAVLRFSELYLILFHPSFHSPTKIVMLLIIVEEKCCLSFIVQNEN